VQYRYRSMDFLRAIAILLVVLAHSVLSFGAPSHLAPLQFGGTGVDLFFVLSGWLLGGVLFKEAHNSGTIDVKRFWIRRWMRTFPAYYTVLILSVLQRYLTKENVEFPWQYFIFTQNYYSPLSFFTISWSLSVEEQFYLFIAPFVVLLVKFGSKSTTITLLILLIIPFTFRELNWFNSLEETHVRIDGCLIGVLLSKIAQQHHSFWKKLSLVAPVLACSTLILYLLSLFDRYFEQWWIPNTNILLLSLIFGSWVILANSNDYWRAAIYFPGAKYIATRSYALYLLHPEVLALQKRYMLDTNFLLYLSISILGSLLLSEVLYRMVEKPLMDIREKFAFSKSNR
jgi:peptidoglycan/LPS O-acetylase OafA/YrhL